MHLADVLLRASLVAVSACDCPDGTVDTSAFATRKSHYKDIDACIANDDNCEALCRAALGLEPAIAITRCVITAANRDGATLAVTYLEPIDCGAGRKPAGYAAPPRRAGAGAWLASIATLEAASVTAFARLARVLVRLHAPTKLVEAARRAIADELAHASAIGALARRHGAHVDAPLVPAVTDASNDREIEHLAIENAVEGQVGETFGALLAACQARAAADPDVRAVFGRIAGDEARHAALAHQLAPWFERRLGWRERNAVARARQDAIARVIATGCDMGLATDEREQLGVPPPDRLRAAAMQLFASVG
jgi:hypothetical protein